jgi:hypothetical protein
MRWVFLEFGTPEKSDGYIKPMHCHPMYYKERIEHVAEKYGAEVAKIMRVEDFGIDLGGMIHKSDQTVEVAVGPHRTISCWEHQVCEVKHMLKNCKKFVSARGIRMRKFARFPGVLCYLSEVDVQKALRLLPDLDPAGSMAHDVEMREALVRANMASRPPEQEPEIRKMLKAPIPAQA